MFSKSVLPNGLRYILAPMPQVKSVTALVMVEAGSRYENGKNNGISHFLEHMMFKGTKKRPSKQDIAVVLDGIGASYNAFTSKEYTGFYVKAAAEHLELALDLMADIIFNSVYDPAEVDKDRGVIIEEINGEEDEPTSKVFQLFEESLFAGCPLAMKVAGTKETVTKISRDEIVSYVNRMYHSGSMVVTLSGQIPNSKSEVPNKSQNQNLNYQNGKNLVQKYFGGVSKGGENRFLPAADLQKKPKATVFFKKTEQAHLVLGVRGYSVSDPKRYAASVMANILGGTMSSRLFLEVREKRSLAYYVGAYAEEYLDTGIVLANAGVKLDRVEEAIKVILDQLEEMKAKVVTSSELARAKDYAKGKMVLALEDSFRVASFYAGQELLEKKILTAEETLAQVEKVTAQEIKEVAQELFQTDRLNLALVGPFKGEEKFIKLLKI